MRHPSLLHRPTPPRVRAGFTLIELIIYIAVSALILVTLAQGMLNILGNRQKTRSLAEVQQAARFVLARIEASTANATSVTAADVGVLSLGGSPALGGEAAGPAASYSLTNGTVYLREGNGSPVALTPTDVRVSQLVFALRTASAGPPIVGVTMAASDTGTPPGPSLTIRTSFSLRQ